MTSRPASALTAGDRVLVAGGKYRTTTATVQRVSVGAQRTTVTLDVTTGRPWRRVFPNAERVVIVEELAR